MSKTTIAVIAVSVALLGAAAWYLAGLAKRLEAAEARARMQGATTPDEGDEAPLYTNPIYRGAPVRLELAGDAGAILEGGSRTAGVDAAGTLPQFHPELFGGL